MRRSISRASKVSSEVQEVSEISTTGIPEAKWNEIQEKEETDMFLLGLREEILQKCLSVCYEKYLEKQAVGFTVHCAYLAWCKVLNIYEMFRDPGDADDSPEKASWQPDLEPEPSIIDSWGSESITADIVQQVSRVDKECEREIPVPLKSYSDLQMEDNESLSVFTNIFDAGEGEYSFSLGSFSTNFLSEETRAKSIFTRTLSMSRESLPLTKPSALLPGQPEMGCRLVQTWYRLRRKKITQHGSAEFKEEFEDSEANYRKMPLLQCWCRSENKTGLEGRHLFGCFSIDQGQAEFGHGMVNVCQRAVNCL